MLNEIWNNKRTIREASGETQESLARMLGISSTHLNKIERGHSSPVLVPLGINYLELLITLEASLIYETRSVAVRPPEGKTGDVSTNDRAS